MTEILNIEIDSEDKQNFEKLTGMNINDGIKILMNSLKYGGKLELDPFYSDENISELKKRIKSNKFEKHELIEGD